MNPNPNKFKNIIIGVFIFFIIIGLIAFSTYKSKSTNTNTVIVQIWGTVDKNIFDSYVTKYKQDKSVDFSLSYSYVSLDTIDSKLVEAIATGKAPDIILIPNSLEKRYLDKVYMIPFTSLPQRTFTDTFVPEAQLYEQSNGYFGIPFFVDPLVMYWNRDMFANAAIAIPPKKWSEFPMLASKLSQSNSKADISQSAVSFGEFANIDNAKALISTLIMQAGSPIVSEDINGKLYSNLDSKSANDIMVPAVSALQFYTDYSNPQKPVYSWNRSLPSSKLFFLSENLATYFGFSSEYQDIKTKNPNLNFDLTYMPQIVDAKVFTTYGDLYGFSILKSSQNILAAYNLILTLINSDSISTLVQVYGVAPARRDIIAAGTTNAVQTIVFNSSLISKGWMDPDSSKTDQIFQNMIENISTGKLEITDAVTKASNEIDSLFK